jgi:hypothetical protein
MTQLKGFLLLAIVFCAYAKAEVILDEEDEPDLVEEQDAAEDGEEEVDAQGELGEDVKPQCPLELVDEPQEPEAKDEPESDLDLDF